MKKWAEALVLLPTFLFLAHWAAFGLDNADTYFHLRAGLEMLDSGWRPWAMGHFSRFDTDQWVSTQWAPQVLMALIVKAGGLSLLELTSFGFYAGLSTVFYTLLRTQASVLWAGLATLTWTVACSTYLSMRPQIWSFLFMGLLVWAFMRAVDQARFPWATLALIWLWPNFHGMWLAGVATAGFLALALGLQTRFSWRHAVYFAGLLVLPACSILGLKAWTDTLGVFTLAYSYDGFVGSEWGPTSFGGLGGALMLASLLAFTYVLARRTAPMSYLDLALAASGIGWLLLGTRSAPLGLFILLFLSLRLAPFRPARNFLPQCLGVATSAILAFSVFALTMPAYPQQNMHVPIWAEARLADLPPGTAVFTDYREGSYLLYAHPHLAIPIHGYSDALTKAEVDRVINIILLRPGWDRDIADLDPAYAFMPVKSPITYALEKAGWRSVQQDEEFILLTPPR